MVFEFGVRVFLFYGGCMDCFQDIFQQLFEGNKFLDFHTLVLILQRVLEGVKILGKG